LNRTRARHDYRSQGAWANRPVPNPQEITMTKTPVTKKEDSKLAVKKESLKNLIVRTDLKGGAAALAVAKICSSCHGC
jgi:hypothetical protein